MRNTIEIPLKYIEILSKGALSYPNLKVRLRELLPKGADLPAIPPSREGLAGGRFSVGINMPKSPKNSSFQNSMQVLRVLAR